MITEWKDWVVAKGKAMLFSTQGFPIFLSFIVMAVLFILFRMKGVELDYEMIKVEKNIASLTLENKELKAREAKLLSAKRLRKVAKDYKLAEPGEKQIIVIP